MPQFFFAEPAEVVLNSLAEALDQMGVGIVLLDKTMRLRFINRRQIEMFDLPTALLTSRPTFRDLLTHAGVRSWFAVAPADLTAYIDQREAAVRAGTIPAAHVDFQDGRRLLFACHACPDGGRILTYTDVSGELRPETLDAMEVINAELRFNSETMEDHASYLASLAEATDENARKVEEARQALEREIVERRELETRLRHMANTDGLTGALNRAGFLAASQTELDRSARDPRAQPGRGLALLMLDIDHFKAVNDRFGHAGGDIALRHLVTVVGNRIRRHDLLGRLGGEEFAILLPGIAMTDAEQLAERLVDRIAADPAVFGHQLIAMTVSIGVAFATVADRSIEPVIARADNALYRAKAAGRNRVMKDQSVNVSQNLAATR